MYNILHKDKGKVDTQKQWQPTIFKFFIWLYLSINTISYPLSLIIILVTIHNNSKLKGSIHTVH